LGNLRNSLVIPEAGTLTASLKHNQDRRGPFPILGDAAGRCTVERSDTYPTWTGAQPGAKIVVSGKP
jgi:hypothetical protein